MRRLAGRLYAAALWKLHDLMDRRAWQCEDRAVRCENRAVAWRGKLAVWSDRADAVEREACEATAAYWPPDELDLDAAEAPERP